MTKKLFEFLSVKDKKRSGVILPLAIFVMAIAGVIVSLLLLSLSSRASFYNNLGEQARNAAMVCLDKADFILRKSTYDPYMGDTACATGTFLDLTGATSSSCSLDVDASSTLSVGDNCSCEASLVSTSTTRYTVDSSGACWNPGGSRQNPDTEIIITANIATGTPPCVSNCPLSGSVAKGGSCDDGCGAKCVSACQVGGGLSCKASGLTWTCQL
jgi:hypothetical protein